MYDLEKANEIYDEMMKEDSLFADKLVKRWREKMPEQFTRTMIEERYGCHILDENTYKEGLQFVLDNKGNKIDPWSKEDILRIAKDYVNIENEDFYPWDLVFWSNVKKGDYGHFITDASKIIRIAIEDLKDKDFYSDPSERAYKWIEYHLEEK
jgi:hypothetical protein